ncbi:MAG: hypothetical protein ACKPGT_05635 [Microcystis sp.]
MTDGNSLLLVGFFYSHQLSVISYQLSVISYQLSVIRCELSVISYQFTDIAFWAHRLRLNHIKTE